MITISYGGTAYTFPNLTEQPYGYSGEAVDRGRAVRQWQVSGIVKRADSTVFDGIFRAWNAAKLLEDDPARTGVVGATVALSGSSPGFNWSTPIACNFVAPPSFAVAGDFVRLSATLEDANERLAVILRAIEEESEQFATLSLGTLTFGGAVVNLTARPNSYDTLPSAVLTPGGSHLISGSLKATEIREVEGWVTSANLTLLEAWLEATVQSTPAPGVWYPAAWTRPVVIRRPDAGVMSAYANVAFTVVKIR